MSEGTAANADEHREASSAYAFDLFEREDGTRQGVALGLACCDNQDCPCTNLLVRATPYDRSADRERTYREPAYSLTYEVTTNRWSGFPTPRSAEEAGPQSALRGVLRRKSSKDLLRREYEQARARREPVANPDYDFSAHLNGTLAIYADVFPSAHVMRLDHEGVEYIYDDHWCVRPSCTCSDGLVDLLVPTERRGGDPNVKYMRSVGAFAVPSGATVPGRPRLDAALVEAALGPKSRDWLSVRRARLRAEAARRWPAQPNAAPALVHDAARVSQAPVADIKAGRNDRCPCGSGKKYKQCCLQKRTGPTTSQPRS